MTSRMSDITIDCADARKLAAFWAEVFGWNVFYDDDPPVFVGPAYPHDGAAPGLLFIPVPEARTVKNRLHLDVQPTDRSRDEEVERLLGLGAHVVEDHRSDDGVGWVWMADPEGNDFCVVRSAAERSAAAVPQHFKVTSP